MAVCKDIQLTSEALFHSVVALITERNLIRIMSDQDLVTAAFTAIFGGGLPSNSIHQLFSQIYVGTVPLWQPPSSSPFPTITNLAHNGITACPEAHPKYRS